MIGVARGVGLGRGLGGTGRRYFDDFLYFYDMEVEDMENQGWLWKADRVTVTPLPLTN